MNLASIKNGKDIINHGLPSQSWTGDHYYILGYGCKMLTLRTEGHYSSKIEDSELHAQIYGYLIFDKESKT